MRIQNDDMTSSWFRNWIPKHEEQVGRGSGALGLGFRRTLIWIKGDNWFFYFK
jgi:hypothetical protein